MKYLLKQVIIESIDKLSTKSNESEKNALIGKIAQLSKEDNDNGNSGLQSQNNDGPNKEGNNVNKQKSTPKNVNDYPISTADAKWRMFNQFPKCDMNPHEY